MTRPNKNVNYMDIAEVVAQRSHDSETKVGAVLINNTSGAIVATGYNGFIRGAPDDALPTTRPEKYEYIIHAEQNLISNCARHGISMDNCSLISTLSPCKLCMRMLINCGITGVIAKNLYRDFGDIEKMKDANVKHWVDQNGFYRITYTMG